VKLVIDELLILGPETLPLVLQSKSDNFTENETEDQERVSRESRPRLVDDTRAKNTANNSPI